MGYDYISFYQSHGVEDLKREGSQYVGGVPFIVTRDPKGRDSPHIPVMGYGFVIPVIQGGMFLTSVNVRALVRKRPQAMILSIGNTPMRRESRKGIIRRKLKSHGKRARGRIRPLTT